MRKFTFLELMIVIAIIGILITILLPSLSQAREKARRSVCLSNLSQFYRGLVSFHQQNNNKLPEGQAVINPVKAIDSIKSGTQWYGHGQLYEAEIITGGELYYCPSSTHPSHQLGGIGTIRGGGGLPVNNTDPLPSLVQSSYNYRSTFDAPSFRAAVLEADDSRSGLMSDHFTGFYSKKYTHKDGHNVYYLDGSGKYVYDKTIVEVRISKKDYNEQEVVFWRRIDP